MPSCLRPDLPPPGEFKVTEDPHRAKLDQNETPVDLPAALKDELARELAARPWNRYPQPGEYRRAKARFAAAVGLAPETIALTVGCDQVIQGAFLLAGGNGRRARWFEPTYPYVPLASRVTGTLGEAVLLGPEVDARVDASTVLAPPAPHLVVLVRPNNPTGGLLARSAIDAALADPDRLVLVDEAYADFAGETIVAEVATHPNLLVGRSLSKAMLAGVRLGFAVGHPEVVAHLERIYTAPYHLSMAQLLVAARYGDLVPHVRAAVAGVAAERARVGRALAALPGVAPRPSHANFVLFAIAGAAGRAARAHARLARDGIRVRDVSGLPGLAGHLRVTIGTPGENDLFLAGLARALDGDEGP